MDPLFRLGRALSSTTWARAARARPAVREIAVGGPSYSGLMVDYGQVGVGAKSHADACACRATAMLAAAALVLGALAACGGGAKPHPAPIGSATSSATITVPAGTSKATVRASDGVSREHVDAATARLIVGLPASTTGWYVTVTVALPKGTTVSVASDGTLGVVGAHDRLRLGLAAPADGYRTIRAGNLLDPFVTKIPSGATAGTGTWTVEDPDPSGSAARTATLTMTVPAARTTATTTAVLVGTTLIASVAWRADGEDGTGSWVVTPTMWGRLSGDIGRAHMFAALTAVEPDADSDVLRKQLLCHVDGATAKSTWNLEPSRPDVSYLAYLLARCNPT